MKKVQGLQYPQLAKHQKIKDGVSYRLEIDMLKCHLQHYYILNITALMIWFNGYLFQWRANKGCIWGNRPPP